MFAPGHPVDQVGTEDQPLELIGVVVKADRELGDGRLGIGGRDRVLVDAHEHVARGVIEQRRFAGPGWQSGCNRRPVAVGAGVEGDRALQ